MWPAVVLVQRALPQVHSNLTVLTKQAAIQQKLIEKLVGQNDHNLDVISNQVEQVQNSVNMQQFQWQTVASINLDFKLPNPNG